MDNSILLLAMCVEFVRGKMYENEYKKKTTLSDLLLRQFVHRCSCITWTLVEHALQKYTKHKYERVGVLLSPMQLIFTELQ